MFNSKNDYKYFIRNITYDVKKLKVKRHHRDKNTRLLDRRI